jgi:carboxyl-terminal processing protease
MSKRKVSSLLLCSTLGVSVIAAGTVIQARRSDAPLGSTYINTSGLKNIAYTPGQGNNPEDANISRVTASLLVQSHYKQQPINATVSSKFFDRYLEALDPLRMYFLESDVQEWESLRPKIGGMVLKGDTSPASQIFARMMERAGQQQEFVKKLLAENKFTFDADETYQYDRKKAARPTTIAEAEALWRQRLRYEYLQEKLNKKTPEKIIEDLTRRYARSARALGELDKDDVLELYLTSLAHVYDPHSDYMGKAQVANFNISMSLQVFGIGAQLIGEDGYCKIAELTPGGPAERSGKLKAGDRIVAVAQGDGEPVDVVDMKVDKVVEQIRGPKGTKVRLTVWPAGAADTSTRKEVVIIREQVKLEDQAAKAKLIEMPDATGANRRLGVIQLPSFYEDMENRGGEHRSTSADVAKLVRKLKAEKAEGIILDLRNNGGGSLAEAIKTTGLFIKKGPIVQVKDWDGSIRVDDDPDPSVLYDGPMMVLTGKTSASASEILAGALQDYGRSITVGDSSTYGKGTVQAILDLAPIMKRYNIKADNPGALKLTIQKFYRAGGSSTQLKGVVPDIVLPSLFNVSEIGEKYMDNPLAWDTIESAKPEQLNRVAPYLAELKKRSDDRLATDKDFTYLRGEVERYKKLMAEKSVSLNEAARTKEKQDAQARADARKKDLLARTEPKVKVYDITLALADKPGLPAPTPWKSQKAKPKPAVTADPDADETPDDPALPTIDMTLNEAQRIMMDYIGLSGTKGTVAQARSK